MLLLELLPEVISKILEEVVCADDLDMAFHLRLVCKMFDSEILRAVCTTHSLDHLVKNISCNRENRIPWVNERLYTQYLLICTLTDKTRKRAYSKALHETLDYIIAKRPADSERRSEYTQTLCTATARYFKDRFSTILNLGINQFTGRSSYQMNLVLAAATVLKLDDLVHDCVSRGAMAVPTCFGHAFSIVAERGDFKMTEVLCGREFSTISSTLAGLQGAITTGHTHLMETILAAYEQLEALHLDPFGPSSKVWEKYARCLELSVEAGQLQISEYLVQKIASVATLHDRPAAYRKYSHSENDTKHLARPIIAFWYDVMLYQSSQRGHENLVQWALDHGADVNISAKRGHLEIYQTALERAASGGHPKIMKLLITHGAQLFPISNGGRWAFERAAREGFLDVIRIMVECGFDLNDQYGLGKTSLLLAAVKRGRIECLQLMLDLALKIDITLDPGKAAHEYASSHGYISIRRLLETHSVAKITLFNIPSEIFSNIVEQMVVDDFDISLCLRVVCKKFDHEILSAVYRTRALGSKGVQGKPYYPTDLIANYLFNRTRGDQLPQNEK